MTEKLPSSLEKVAPPSRYEQEQTHLTDLLAQTEHDIDTYHNAVLPLVEQRLLPEKGFNPAGVLADQLYDVDYDQDLIFEALNTRKGGNLGFGKEAETIAPNSSLGHTIFTIAQRFEFIPREVASWPHDAFNLRLGMGDSRAEKLPRTLVEAVIVGGGKGATNSERLHNALEDIRRGIIDSSKIIVATCDRPVIDSDEKETLTTFQLPLAKSEFDMAVADLNYLEGTTLDPREAQSFMVPFEQRKWVKGKQLEPAMAEGKYIETTVALSGRDVRVILVSAPFDPRRRLPGGNMAIRANTEETFIAAKPFLADEIGATVVIESHDIWINAQKVIGEEVFGLNGKRVLATGPRRLDRITYDAEHGFVLNKPEAVLDEIAKTYRQLVELKMKIMTRLAYFDDSATSES